MSGSHPDRLARLRRVPLFADLADSELKFLAARAVIRKFQAGKRIFSEGEVCEGLYIVDSGTVRIFTTSASGREQVLAIAGAGHSIAEVPLFDGGPYPASAVAITASSLLFIGKRDFQTLCLEHPEVSWKLLKVLGTRLRKLVGIIEELSFTTVRHRLARLFLRLAQRKGKRTSRGIEFRLSASQQELAAHIGTVRELVSRNLSRLQAEGLVKTEGKTVVIPRLEALEAEVKGDH